MEKHQEMKSIPIAAADPGYGYFKYAYIGTDGELRLGKFPTAVAEVNEKSPLDYEDGVEYQGKYYYVGEDAEICSPESFVDSLTRDFNIKYTPLLLYYLFLKEKIHPAVISLSLAIGEYKEKKERLAETCSNFLVNGKEFSQKVEVFPQGVGVWVDIGQPQNAFIIDIGEKTVDFLVIFGGKIRSRMSQCWLDKGVNLATSELVDELDVQGIKISPSEARESLKTGKVLTLDGEKDISELVNEIKNRYIDKILKEVFKNENYRNIARKTGKIYIAGGGGYLVTEEAKEKYKLIVPDNPEFSNVKGFLKLLQGGSNS
jgi:plasmid segregation protein ParM